MKYLRPTCFFASLLLFQVNIAWTSNHFPNEDVSVKKSREEDFGGRRYSSKDRSLANSKSSADPKLGHELSSIYNEYILYGDAGYDVNLGPSSPVVKTYISVDISFVDVVDNESAKNILRPIEVDFINCFGNICSVSIHISSLKAISEKDSVLLLQSVRAATNGGSFTTEGDMAMFANTARSKHSVNGSGILIGVLSDSYDCFGGAANDTLTGDLPSGNSNIFILADLNATECATKGGSDEGRAMMQLIHDVAPGARLAFRTALRGQGDFAAGILELAAAGCDIIVDDVVYFYEPMFQDGIIAQAVDQVVSQGIPYFSSAGNQARTSWVAQNGFKPASCSEGDACHKFGTNSGGSPITKMRITMRRNNRERFFMFQWNDPYASNGGAICDVDIILSFVNGTKIDDLGGELVSVRFDPIEGFRFVPSEYSKNSSNVTASFDLSIVTYDCGPSTYPSYMKLVVFGEVTSFEFPTDSPTIYGHRNTASVAAVGAAFYNETPAFGVSPPVISLESSAGGTPIFFTKNGTRLSSPETRYQPRFTGPDGGATTFFGSDFDGVYRFFGTSASVAHVAAVAALMLEFRGGNRSLTPGEIYWKLSTTAIDMDDPSTSGFDVGFDFGTGSGLVNASAALDALVLPTRAPTLAPIVPTPVAFPIATTPVAVPTSPKKCGLFGFRLFCPFTLCGLVGRLLGFCNA